MLKGACNCGAVAFEADGEPAGIYVCHCSICRRATGSNGIAVVLVGKEQFRWVSGVEQIRAWKKPGANWECWFCAVCGSPLPGENDPTRMFVPAGCISEGAEALSVIHHIWVESRAPWDVIGDTGKQHPEGFGA